METKTQDLTVSGDRQTGKSYLACLAALHAAHDGERVLFECESSLLARIRFEDLRQMSESLRDQPYRVHLANGDQHMTWANGGSIRMIDCHHHLPMEATADLYVMDGVGPRVLTAARTIRTER